MQSIIFIVYDWSFKNDTIIITRPALLVSLTLTMMAFSSENITVTVFNFCLKIRITRQNVCLKNFGYGDEKNGEVGPKALQKNEITFQLF